MKDILEFVEDIICKNPPTTSPEGAGGVLSGSRTTRSAEEGRQTAAARYPDLKMSSLTTLLSASGVEESGLTTTGLMTMDWLLQTRGPPSSAASVVGRHPG
jgi:hypothetical protein